MLSQLVCGELLSWLGRSVFYVNGATCLQHKTISIVRHVLLLLQVLAWSAESPDDFYRDNRYIESGGGQGFTYHSIYDPAIDVATPMLISNTEHDMFCPGITMMANGDILVTGGQNAKKASIYQLATNKWVAAAEMSISRGYGSSALLSNGKVCTPNIA